MHNAIRVYDDIMTDKSLCDDIIKDFHSLKQHHRAGEIYKVNGDVAIDALTKSSTDMSFNDLSEHIRDAYIEHLGNCIEQYKKDIPFVDTTNSWEIVEAFNVQWYKPGEGFIEWHSENLGMSIRTIKRMAVFMTYLNDVTDDGGTEFQIYKQKLDAVKGRTVIWPADWSYVHRGIPSMTQEKYIITGWLSYNNVKGEIQI